MPGHQKISKKLNNKDSSTYTRETKNKVILCETCPLLDRSREITENQRVNSKSICPCK